MKTGEIAAYCDGKVTVRKCGARQFSGSKRSFPKRDKETALAQAFDLGLSDAPQEYIDLFESSWGVKLNNSQSEAKNHEANTPENPEITFKTVTADPGTTPDIPADKSAENGDNSGISGSTDEDVYNALYGG
ncbi:hypothetical protein [Paremcibacter congregatus]|uniref:hypothetical protein n=1 Tax=Paremcibacter congregatus TaxID=2043170 RepID=UPI0030EC5606